MKKDNQTSSRVATALCAATFLLVTTLTQAQQTLQVLHDHVLPAVSGGKAAPVGVLPITQRLNLAIMLPIRNYGEMMDLLKRQHDPASPDFRKFLSVDEFTEQFGPTKDDYQAVVAFAKANGFTVSYTSKNRMVVDVNGSVEQIEKTFHVMMAVYQHPTEDRTFYSPDREPSLNLSVPVNRIVGLNNFSIPRPKLQRAPAGYEISSRLTGSGPGGQYLGSDMRAAYYGNGPLTGSGQSVGLFEFDGYNLSDVNGTFDGQTYTVPINNVIVDGASAGSDGNDGEQVLDIVQAISMAPGLNQVLVYIGPCCGDSTAVDILNRMATDNTAKQLSCSWGWNPDQSALDPIFAEIGVQGQTFFTASGDNGAIGPGTGGALVWPADDFFQTAVGATDLTTTGPGGAWQSETAWSNSAGGPSDNGVSIPWYQVGLANASNQGSNTLRNIPDIAAEGNFDNFLCNDGSCGGGVGGTSYAAPRWAGFMALVNQQAALVGFPPIGFINPDVYAIGQSSSYANDFHDITSGNNDCCGQSTFWNAVTGYDLVTGWGTPTGPNLIYSLVRVAPPTIGSANSTTFETGVAGSFQVSATGSPSSTFTESGTLPNHVTLSPTGLLSGTPAAGTGGIYNITITANNGVAPNGTQSFTLTVGQAPLITSVNHATFEAGVFGSFQVTGTGFPTAITYTASGPMPGGVSLSPTGLLSGIPATGGIFTFTITGSNGFAPNATQSFTLTVTKAPTSCGLTASSSLFSNQPITFSATVAPVAPAVGSPSGTVSFIDSSFSNSVIGTGHVINGVAKISVVLKSPPLVHYIKAIYSGDGSFKTCQSQEISERHQ